MFDLISFLFSEPWIKKIVWNARLIPFLEVKYESTKRTYFSKDKRRLVFNLLENAFAIFPFKAFQEILIDLKRKILRAVAKRDASSSLHKVWNLIK